MKNGSQKVTFLLFDNPDYRARVISEPIYDGMDYILVCQLVTADITKSVPSTLLAVGKSKYLKNS